MTADWLWRLQFVVAVEHSELSQRHSGDEMRYLCRKSCPLRHFPVPSRAYRLAFDSLLNQKLDLCLVLARKLKLVQVMWQFLSNITRESGLVPNSCITPMIFSTTALAHMRYCFNTTGVHTLFRWYKWLEERRLNPALWPKCSISCSLISETLFGTTVAVVAVAGDGHLCRFLLGLVFFLDSMLETSVWSYNWFSVAAVRVTLPFMSPT